MNKIITDVGIFDINISTGADVTDKGEHYIVCPACTPGRKPEHRKEKLLAINLYKTPHPWRCNHCGRSGYVVDEEYMRNAKIKPLLDIRSEISLTDPMVMWFWEERRISKKTIVDLDITSSMESIKQIKHVEGQEALHGQYVNMRCINFKYKKDGILINIKYRDKNKNFKLVTDATKIMYNIDSLKGSKSAIITEGEIDVASYHECGRTAVTSVPNGSNITDEEKAEYEKTGKFRNNLNMDYLDLCIGEFEDKEVIYIATDDDPAGIKLREELARRLGKNRCRYVRFSVFKKPDGSPCKDANEVLKYYGPEKLYSTIDNSVPFPMEGITTMAAYWDRMKSYYHNGRPKGISTGFKSLDPHFNWMPGWLTLMNGFPQEGKTTMVWNLIAISAVLYDWSWGIYSPENYPPEGIGDTLSEILVGDTLDRYNTDRMSENRYENVVKNFIDNHFYFVDREEGYTPADLRQIKKDLIRQHGIKGFVTDPWKNLIHHLRGDSIDGYLQKELSAEVRLATHNDLINLIIHHPPTPERSKDKIYKPPSEFELIGGQIWYASAYAMLCIHRHNHSDWTNTFTEVHVQKIKEQKLAGIPTSRDNPVILRFDRRTGRFFEREDITDLNSKYTVFPFKDYLMSNQGTFDGF